MTIPNPEDDPKLEGYKPIALFRITDVDRSSRRIRDDPLENILLSGTVYDFNIESVEDTIDDWNV